MPEAAATFAEGARGHQEAHNAREKSHGLEADARHQEDATARERG